MDVPLNWGLQNLIVNEKVARGEVPIKRRDSISDNKDNFLKW
jgi:hypothetical protein